MLQAEAQLETAKLNHDKWMADEAFSFARRTKNKDLPPPPIWPLELAQETPRVGQKELKRSSVERRGARNHGAPFCWPKSAELRVGMEASSRCVREACACLL